jgi:hypothetical protein
MCGDHSVEYMVVEHIDARLIISQVVVSWLIVVIEDNLATAGDNSLRRTHDPEAVYLI